MFYFSSFRNSSAEGGDLRGRKPSSSSRCSSFCSDISTSDLSTGASSASPVSHLLDSPAASPRLPFLSRSSLSATSVVSSQSGGGGGLSGSGIGSDSTPMASLKSAHGGGSTDGLPRVSFTMGFDDSEEALMSTSNNNSNNNNYSGGESVGSNNNISGNKSNESNNNSSGSLKLPPTPPTTSVVSSSPSSLTTSNDLNSASSLTTTSSAQTLPSLPAITTSVEAFQVVGPLAISKIESMGKLPSLLSTPPSKCATTSSPFKAASDDQTLPRFAISIEDGPKSPINLKELSPGKFIYATFLNASSPISIRRNVCQ